MYAAMSTALHRFTPLGAGRVGLGRAELSRMFVVVAAQGF